MQKIRMGKRYDVTKGIPANFKIKPLTELRIYRILGRDMGVPV